MELSSVTVETSFYCNYTSPLGRTPSFCSASAPDSYLFDLLFNSLSYEHADPYLEGASSFCFEERESCVLGTEYKNVIYSLNCLFWYIVEMLHKFTPAVAKKLIDINNRNWGALSFKRLAGKLADEGISVSHVTVRTWCRKVGMRRRRRYI